MTRPVLAILIAASMALAADEKISIRYEAGRLTTRIENASMRAVLDEVAMRAEIRIAVAEAAGDSEVSVDMDAMPLDIALRALLAEYDAFFYYGGAPAEPSRLRAIWVFPKGEASAFQPVGSGAAVSRLEPSLSDPSADVRQKAYEALMSRPDVHSREIVADAIRGGREQDDELRQRILSIALTKGSVVPPETLADLARGDRSEQIRWMALDALAQHESAGQVAEACLADANSAVRQRAADILAEMKAAAQRSEGTAMPPEQQP